MTKTVIVARTRMASGVCIGGITFEGQSVRLLQPGSFAQQTSDAPYEIGQVWELDLQPRPNVTPPHVEDVGAEPIRFLGLMTNMADFIRRQGATWQGSPDALFDGALRVSSGGAGFIAENGGLPTCSTGFWLSDQPLHRESWDGDFRYSFTATSRIRSVKYVGFEKAPDSLPTGTWLRFSLARWWCPADKPDWESRCYLQLSGWFT